MKISHRIIEGADHLIFEGGGTECMGYFRKNILHTDFDGKNSCKEIPGKIILH